MREQVLDTIDSKIANRNDDSTMDEWYTIQKNAKCDEKDEV